MTNFCQCRKCIHRRMLGSIVDDKSEPGAWAEAMRFPPWSERMVSKSTSTGKVS